MRDCGVRPDAIGCELCKPVCGSILASLCVFFIHSSLDCVALTPQHSYNEHIMQPRHHALQDTNDRFLGNIQRNGTFSVIPRMAAGEVKPEQLIVIGEIAKQYDLCVRITMAAVAQQC